MLENKHYYRTQNTLRLSEPELNFIDENYEIIADTTDRIPIAKFFLKAVTGAVSQIKPKEVVKEVVKEVENPECKEQIKQLQEQLQQYEARIRVLSEQIPSKKAIVLNFPDKWHRYIWGVLEISKKMGFAKSYEELVEKVFTVVNKRGELVLTEDDLNYLDELGYPFAKDLESKEELNQDNADD